MKRALRTQMKEMLATIPPAKMAEKSRLIAKNVIALEEFRTAKTILLYMPLPNEVDTTDITLAALAWGKIVAMPKIINPADGIMEAVRCKSLKSDDFEIGLYDIPVPTGDDMISPQQLELIIIPALAFDRHGARLGRGGGFYDRYLPLLGDHCIKSGLAITEQIVDDLPTAQHDANVDMIVTDKDVLRSFA